MTKHLVSTKVENHLNKMRMTCVGGRAEKAARLHTTSENNALPEWREIRKRFEERRDGDRWLSRGHQGVWHRIHSTPRTTLFTPFKVPKGPSRGALLQSVRFTYGITQSGRHLEFHDAWQNPERRHFDMKEPWIGCTVFTDGSTSLTEALSSIGTDRHFLLNAPAPD